MTSGLVTRNLHVSSGSLLTATIVVIRSHSIAANSDRLNVGSFFFLYRSLIVLMNFLPRLANRIFASVSVKYAKNMVLYACMKTDEQGIENIITKAWKRIGKFRNLRWLPEMRLVRKWDSYDDR